MDAIFSAQFCTAFFTETILRTEDAAAVAAEYLIFLQYRQRPWTGQLFRLHLSHQLPVGKGPDDGPAQHKKEKVLPGDLLFPAAVEQDAHIRKIGDPNRCQQHNKGRSDLTQMTALIQYRYQQGNPNGRTCCTHNAVQKRTDKH